ncbi:MAG: riboflavin synthase [Candidatus Latescibacteria bacterium]|nr:riboflavin synthase [Candidatus Latescibacterota bacterium]
MFTGIVESVGSIARVEDSGSARRVRIEAAEIVGSLSAGDSVSVDGVCLTVERADGRGFESTAVAETLARTTLGERGAGDRVNLERAATLARYFGGHLVQGHVDAVARVTAFDPRDEAPELVLELPEDVFALCIDKGSIAVDGVSLTIASRPGARRVAIAVVPHTIARTTMAGYAPGRRVNVEADVIAKYVREFVRRDD